ncbi:GNAT family N-acetyltransferase [Luteococcus japonicus]|uniref:GNAT family N-acetyltransferase n=1 Tax=Luteococcus japonicus TaxID=33984 RepID=UPI00319DAA13
MTHTERLTLVPVGPDDLDDWARLYTAPDLPEVPMERHMAGIQANVEHWLNDGLGYWLVRDSLHDAPIGVGGVRRSKELPDGAWSLYYRFAPEAQGQGYAEEMARAGIAALQLIDRDAELRAAVRPGNAASVAIATGLGLQLDEERDGVQVYTRKVSEL